MKKLLLVFGALLVMAGVVSTNLWLELKAEKQINAELTAQLTEARLVPRTAPASSGPAPSVAPVPQAVAPAVPAAASPVAPRSDSDVVMRATAAAISAAATASVTGTGESDLMKDPEYRKAQLTQTRLRLAQSNPGLAVALGISEREANRLFQLMAEQQLKLTAELSAITAGGGVSATSIEEMTRRTRSIEDPLRAELGEARYAQYQDYQRNVRPALTQVASIGSAMSSAGLPLTEAQSKGLAAVMLTETQRQRQVASIPRPIPNPGAPRSIADSLQESLARQDENNKGILQAAAAHLNAAQLEVLQRQFDQQAAQRQRTIQSARELDARRVLPQTPQASTP